MLPGFKAETPLAREPENNPADMGMGQVLISASPPDESGAGEAAVLARLRSVMKMASPGQEKLCAGLFASGKTELEIAKELVADLAEKLKASVEQCAELQRLLDEKQSGEPDAPVDSEEARAKAAAAMLKALSASAPQSVPTNAQKDRDIAAECKAIKDPKEAQAFYMSHREQLKNAKLNPNKEG
jgi:hypothetical protein